MACIFSKSSRYLAIMQNDACIPANKDLEGGTNTSSYPLSNHENSLLLLNPVDLNWDCGHGLLQRNLGKVSLFCGANS